MRLESSYFMLANYGFNLYASSTSLLLSPKLSHLRYGPCCSTLHYMYMCMYDATHTLALSCDSRRDEVALLAPLVGSLRTIAVQSQLSRLGQMALLRAVHTWRTAVK